MTENDIGWAGDLGRKRYPARFDSFTTEGWFRNIVLKQPVMFLPQRLSHAFCISMLSILPWLPSDVECNICFICADDGHMWQAMKLLRASVDWARMRKCNHWRLSSDTDYDLAVMARRIGAVEVTPRFVITF